MIILGVDPGFHYAGFSILKKEGQKVYLLEAGFLKMSPTKALDERIGIFYDFFLNKILFHGVTDLSLETPFLGKNAQNFLKLGYLRGILYLLATKNKLKLHEFSPRQVKQSVTGFGGADKDQVSRIIIQLFPTLAKPDKADVTDAIAVSLCALWQTKLSYMQT